MNFKRIKKYVKIISVKIVSGWTLNSNWKRQMQIVKTTEGDFIDNLPGNHFGHFKNSDPGYNWESLIGQSVYIDIIILDSNQAWINTRYTNIADKIKNLNSSKMVIVDAPKKIKINKEPLETIVAKRNIALENGKCKFTKQDGTFILADDKGMYNDALPTNNKDIRLNIYALEGNIILEWNWEVQ